MKVGASARRGKPEKEDADNLRHCAQQRQRRAQSEQGTSTLGWQDWQRQPWQKPIMAKFARVGGSIDALVGPFHSRDDFWTRKCGSPRSDPVNRKVGEGSLGEEGA